MGVCIWGGKHVSSHETVEARIRVCSAHTLRSHVCVFQLALFFRPLLFLHYVLFFFFCLWDNWKPKISSQRGRACELLKTRPRALQFFFNKTSCSDLNQLLYDFYFPALSSRSHHQHREGRTLLNIRGFKMADISLNVYQGQGQDTQVLPSSCYRSFFFLLLLSTSCKHHAKK